MVDLISIFVATAALLCQHVWALATAGAWITMLITQAVDIDCADTFPTSLSTPICHLSL